ncbi:multiple sugar transport system permease protein [Friedmanniella endophytica]|uniref:Multiple sugar transport system permease protein n=1 Tax=Microlunatus kandeliicorticis TaxID=1759536 RepID=A0A7W3ITP1_9ACTN|nr:sugar ABC transporter permease [Microlunatus kandeliicorticis]MBA8795020.1 multiple sugar transport system permease protein [Microlunatus kandeliicorticis]
MSTAAGTRTGTAAGPTTGADRRTVPPRRRGSRMRRREALAGYLFISPWIVGFLVFTLGAMVYSLVISFSHYSLATDLAVPAGLDNYENLVADPKVRIALANTLFYAVLAVPLEIVLALLLAGLLHRLGRGAGVFRTIYYLPKMTPAVATASIFLLLLNGNTGAINKGLSILGIQGPQWLLDPDWVKPSIVLMTLWGVSGTMVIFLAALKNVPRELYEVASLDGAGPVRQFFAVTVPMISGAIFFNVLVLTIAALQVFDQAYLLYGPAGTGTTPDAALFYGVYLFRQAFEQFNFGFAAAMAWVLFVLVLIITVIQVRVGNRFVYYEGEVR